MEGSHEYLSNGGSIMSLIEWILYGILGLCVLLVVGITIGGSYVIHKINEQQEKEFRRERGLDE